MTIQLRDATDFERMMVNFVVYAATLSAVAVALATAFHRNEGLNRRALSTNLYSSIIHRDEVTCRSQIRMSRAAYFKLRDVIRQREYINDIFLVYLDEQLVMFLHTIGHNLRKSNIEVDAEVQENGGDVNVEGREEDDTIPVQACSKLEKDFKLAQWSAVESLHQGNRHGSEERELQEQDQDRAHLEAKHIRGKPFLYHKELSIIISNSMANVIGAKTTSMGERDATLEDEDICESAREALVGEDIGGKDVEEGDIRETPTHSKVSEKGKSTASTASPQIKRKKMAMSDTLERISKAVSGLGSAVKEYKNIPNPLIDEVCDAVFHIDGVADDVTSRACTGISSDVNMSKIFLKMNDVMKLAWIQSKYGSGSNDRNGCLMTM
ncbi:hypothetical protein AMTR_s00081p00020570 [Amborella trichopoda]|uniref:DUF8040 domain-containing protein n=1 Tax=Amborella trichopoda TaxID=13333 RepID=W1PA34_AMBTC|nr:hypothetical protein AMTR_s00081p00020570 [Amborella trichopoda]